MENLEKNDGWEIYSITIEQNLFSKDREISKYKGKIRFKNGTWEDFTANIPPEELENILEIMGKVIVTNAEKLSNEIKSQFEKWK